MYNFIEQGYGKVTENGICLIKTAPNWAKKEYEELIEEIKLKNINNNKITELGKEIKREMMEYICNAYKVDSECDLEMMLDKILEETTEKKIYAIIESKILNGEVNVKLLEMNISNEEAIEKIDYYKTDFLECNCDRFAENFINIDKEDHFLYAKYNERYEIKVYKK